MKICRLQFKLLLLPAVCLCLGLLLFVPTTKAEEIGYDFSLNNVVSGNSGNNNYIGLDFIASTTNITSFDFKFGNYYNGQQKTFTYQICENPNQSGVSDPCSGLTVLGTGDFTTTSPNDGGIINIPFESAVNLVIGHRYGIMLKTAISGYSLYFHVNGSENEGTQLIGVIADGENRDFWAIIYYEATPPTYCGDGLCQMESENSYSCPSDCIGLDTPVQFQSWYNLNTNATGIVSFQYDTNIFTEPTDYLTIYRCDTTKIDGSGNLVCDTYTNIGTSTIWTPVDTEFNNPTGNGNILLTSTSTGYIKYAAQAYKTGSNPYIFSPVEFDTIWQNATDLNPADFIGIGTTTASNALEKLLGQTSYQAACTSEEWNATSTYLGINLTLAKCSIVKTMLDLGNVVARIPQNIASGLGTAFQNLFPFNVPIKIKNCWTQSASSTLPTDIAWLNATDTNGDLTIEIPANWNRGATGTKLIIWGDSIFKNGDTKLAAVFVKIRSLSTYLFWLTFIITMWNIGKNIYNEVRYQDTIDTHRDNDWQL